MRRWNISDDSEGRNSNGTDTEQSMEVRKIAERIESTSKDMQWSRSNSRIHDIPHRSVLTSSLNLSVPGGCRIEMQTRPSSNTASFMVTEEKVKLEIVVPIDRCTLNKSNSLHSSSVIKQTDEREYQMQD